MASPARLGGLAIGAHRVLLVATVLFASASLASLAGAKAPQVDGELRTDDPIRLSGDVEVAAVGGAHLEDLQHPHEVAIEANEITVETAWERGREVEVPGGTYRLVEQGNDTTTLTDVELTVTSWRSGTEILLTPDSLATIDAEASGFTRLEALPSESVLAWAGYGGEGVSSGDNPTSYEYRTQRSLTSLSSLDGLEAEGSLTVFPNNATLEARSDEGKWSNWTGFRAKEETAGTREYELRVSVLHAEDAQLKVEAADQVSLFAPRPTVDLAGTLDVRPTRGSLEAPDGRLNLDEDRTRLYGEGRIEASPAETDEIDDLVGLDATVRGTFEMTGSQALPQSGTTPSEGWGLGPALVAASLAGVASILAIGLRRASPWLAALPAPVRQRLYDRYRARAAGHENAGRRRAAARSYETMAALRPWHPAGWYGAALHRLEAGDRGRTVELVHQARQRLEECPLDLVELQVAAAADRGQIPAARQALLDLADASPRKAEALVEELSLGKLAEDPAVARALQDEAGRWSST